MRREQERKIADQKRREALRQEEAALQRQMLEEAKERGRKSEDELADRLEHVQDAAVLARRADVAERRRADERRGRGGRPRLLRQERRGHDGGNRAQGGGERQQAFRGHGSLQAVPGGGGVAGQLIRAPSGLATAGGPR